MSDTYLKTVFQITVIMTGMAGAVGLVIAVAALAVNVHWVFWFGFALVPFYIASFTRLVFGMN